MRHHLRVVSLVVLSLAVAVVAPAMAFAAYQAVAGTQTVTYEATGSMGMRFTGTTHELTAVSDATNVTITVPLAHLTSGMSLRDQHQNTHLDAAHHGTVQLVVPLASIHVPTTAPTTGTVRGTLKVKGLAKPFSFTYRATPAANGQIRVHGTGTVTLNDYGISVPSYLGITLRPTVAIAADFTLRSTP
jgi:polyisoprenoid-binding protein YceI